jgi:PHD/YefM family antitoxin component YafN of YafNO toxin-antitoxin module
MQNVNISNFRKDIFAYASQVVDFGEPINVGTKNGNMIVLSEEEYKGMVETLYLIGNPKVREDLLESMKARREDLVEIDWRKDLNELNVHENSTKALRKNKKQ